MARFTPGALTARTGRGDDFDSIPVPEGGFGAVRDEETGKVYAFGDLLTAVFASFQLEGATPEELAEVKFPDAWMPEHEPYTFEPVG